jgi:hypothetical protein
MLIGTKSIRKLIWPVIAALLICLVIGAEWWAVRGADADRRARVFAFPDGSEGEFLGTAVGGAAFTTETLWQRVARRCLPLRCQNWLPAFYDVGSNSSYDSNTLMVYLRFFPHSQRNFEPIGGFDTLGYRWGSYQTVGDNGFCYPRRPADMIVRHASSGAEIYSFGIKAYARQQPEFLLNWWDDAGKIIATLNVPNPIRGPFPAWRPLPLPQTQTNKPVALTLENLRERKNAVSRFLQPQFRVTSTNPGWANANVTFESLSDATGNESIPQLQAPDGTFLLVPAAGAGQEIGVLSSGEPAWKLRAVVDRKRPRDFADGEKLVLTNLPLPSPGQFIPIDRTADCAGLAANALVLAGGGTFSVSSGGTRSMSPPDESLKHGGSDAFWSASGTLPVVRTWSSEMPFMLIEMRNTRPDDEIQIYAFDERGREAKVVMHDYDPATKGNSGYEPTFVPPTGAKSLTVIVVVSRPLQFEFLVNPTDIVTAKN